MNGFRLPHPVHAERKRIVRPLCKPSQAVLIGKGNEALLVSFGVEDTTGVLSEYSSLGEGVGEAFIVRTLE